MNKMKNKTKNEEKKYNQVLTVVLVIAVLLIVALLGFWIYDIYKTNLINREANEAINEFDNEIENNKKQKQKINVSQDGNLLNLPNIQVSNETTQNTTSKIAKKTYKGFTMLGKIEIPKIELNYPVLDRASDAALEVAVGVNWGPGLNEVGNTVIFGHNYKNKTFFSRLKELNDKDPIYITDNTGRRLKYVIYNIYETTSQDFEYASRDTAGKREITLSTCTDDVQNRLIIWAKEEG